jgi:hypothetical protein
MKTATRHNAVAALLSMLLVLVQAHAAEMAEAPGSLVAPEPAMGLDERLRARCANLGPESVNSLSPRLLAFTNGALMTDMVTDPAEFARLMEAAADPDSAQAMMACAPGPTVWDAWIASLSDADSMTQAASRIMNPGFFARWMMAPMDPEVQQSMARMMNPANATRWAAAIARPDFHAPMFQFMDPGFYTARMQWFADPRTFRPLLYLMEAPEAETLNSW